MDFETKVKSMKASEIIMAMVEGLKNPVVKVNMGTFGMVAEEDDGTKACYGCAATNAVLRIAGVKKLPIKWLPTEKDDTYPAQFDMLAPKVKATATFLETFEESINDLRCGYIGGYNSNAEVGGFARIDTSISDDFDLPDITTRNYTNPEILARYIALANALKAAGN